MGRTAPLRAVWRAATDPVIATFVHGALLWLWHLPALFDAALRDEGLHLLQHASFFGSAVLFWWALLHGTAYRRGHGIAIAAIFVTAVHSSLLGALLVVAPRVLYQGYAAAAFSLSPLEDQQLAGLVMWVPAGLVYTAHRPVAAGAVVAPAGRIGTGRCACRRRILASRSTAGRCSPSSWSPSPLAALAWPPGTISARSSIAPPG